MKNRSGNQIQDFAIAMKIPLPTSPVLIGKEAVIPAGKILVRNRSGNQAQDFVVVTRIPLQTNHVHTGATKAEEIPTKNHSENQVPGFVVMKTIPTSHVLIDAMKKAKIRAKDPSEKNQNSAIATKTHRQENPSHLKSAMVLDRNDAKDHPEAEVTFPQEEIRNHLLKNRTSHSKDATTKTLMISTAFLKRENRQVKALSNTMHLLTHLLR